MDIEYDPEADAAYIWLTARPAGGAEVVHDELWPQELSGKVGLLFDVKGRLVGLEVLEASSRLPEETIGARG